MKNEIVVDRQNISSLQLVMSRAQMQLNEILDFSDVVDDQAIEIPIVYLSQEEACRILSITNPTMKSIVEYGLLDVEPARTNKRDRYLLGDVLWLRTKPFRGARKSTLDAILLEKVNRKSQK